jgi:hypothetical protein
MNSIRRHHRSLAALAASLFLAVWASMAIAPCLMAAEAIMGGDCPHCPDPPPPCHENGAATGCSFVDGYDFDGRTPGLPRLELQLVALPASELDTVALPHGSGIAGAFLARAPPHASGPRLHLRNCVLND